jgi:hypothetical protein
LRKKKSLKEKKVERKKINKSENGFENLEFDEEEKKLKGKKKVEGGLRIWNSKKKKVERGLRIWTRRRRKLKNQCWV